MGKTTQELLARSYLIESSLAELLNKEPFQDISLAQALLMLNPPKIITKDFFMENKLNIINNLQIFNLEKELAEKIIAFFNIKALEEEKKEDECEILDKKKKFNVRIVEAYEPEARKISVEDFVKYFRNRYSVIRNFLQEHELEGLSNIGKISSQRRNISVIGMVANKRITKNKNIIIELEDLTGRISAVINHEKKELFEEAKNIVLDEVIGISGMGSQEIIFVNKVVFPDIAAKEKKKINLEHYAAFTSDTHVGSNKFLEENFLRFIDWLNGKIGSLKQKEIARKVKYFFIVGDLVDGVGVYPGQEKELVIGDIKEQYAKLAELLKKIRKDVAIIICPGGKHDAVRHIEPQPKLDREIASPLYELENVIITTNPSTVNIGDSKTSEGLNVLMYHGDSYDYYMFDIDFLRMNNAKLRPEMIMKFLLKKRHLAPTHTSTPYFPGDEDFLIIKTIPDVFVSAHIHKSSISNYNNILVVSCSCWQSLTSYQEKFGHEPDPCKIPILNMKTGKVSMLDFS